MQVVESQPFGSGSLLAVPPDPTSAVLLLSGSSGRLESGRARLLAQLGAVALALQWFGGPGQAPSISEVPLESFGQALDLLRSHAERLAVVGVSKGAEAALLLAAHVAQVDVVVGCAPTSVVWAGLGGERPQRSSFTWQREPLPFVPYDEQWRATTEPPAFRGHYAQSLRTYADRVAAATIPVEAIGGDVVLAAGGDDQVWPSAEFAEQIASRRADHGLTTSVLVHPTAGHRLLLPTEQPDTGPATMQRGGTLDADRELGASLWATMVEVLPLGPAR